MFSTYKDVVCNQFQAALNTLKRCVDQCPDELWQKPVVNNPLSQSVFHCLFFTDLYLCPNIGRQREQDFHKKHADVFGDYEQLEDRKPVATYEKIFISDYLEFCLKKSSRVVQLEDEDELFISFAGFPWLSHLRIAEVHLYNIRHIQHHAAQIVAFLRKEAEIEVGWVKSRDE